MKTILKIEELALFLLGIYLFSKTSYSWWVFPALLLTPDIGMLGYLINSKIGAFTYNIFHHKGIAVGVLIFGLFFEMEWVTLVGIILFAHSAFDRMLGYGLKHTDSFANTHLGRIGKN